MRYVPPSVKFEFAVLRFRALLGTESFDIKNFASKCQQCLFDSLQKENEFFQSAKKVTIQASKPEDIEYSVDEINKRKMLCFVIGLQPIGYSANQLKSIRIFVAVEMDDSVSSANASREFCENNKIIVVNNLFSFAQMGYDEAQGCAERDIVRYLKEKLQPYAN